MIFRPQLADLVASGRKVETRRPVKIAQPCRYVVGRTYAVQPGRGKKAIARIRVVSVERQHLRDISPGAIHREGFESHRAFFAYWRKLYGSVDAYQLVWAIRFELVEAA